MIKMGEYNLLTVVKEKSMGVFLDDGDKGILLPNRFVPKGTQVGDRLKVFLYHDGEDRPIATTQQPLGVLGDIIKLTVVSTTSHGAFLDWGLMKDLFIPRSAQRNFMQPAGSYIVKIVMDEQTGRLTATEKFDASLTNETLTVHEKELVDLLVYRRSDLGYVVIINNIHTGVLHSNEIYRPIEIGDRFKGFVKKITPARSSAAENAAAPGFLIDVAAGKPGYDRVEDESSRVMRLLQENDGYLPFNDKSSPEKIYSFFSMSKKTFKMTTGKLFKERKLLFTQTGIQLSGK
jgi:uncharacterized protein